MPELPEVETIRRSFKEKLLGKTIKSFSSQWAKKVSPPPAAFVKKIKGKKILDVFRVAKILVIKVSPDDYILIHLKLTGQLVYKPKTNNQKLTVGGHPQQGGLDNLPNKFTHHLFEFTDGSMLFFNDLRKFGWVKLVNQEAIHRLAVEAGTEPLSTNFTFKKFQEIIRKYPNRPIKQVLLDQTLISGVGNIYADESLFAARIRPMRKAGRVNLVEQKKLYKAIIAILNKAVLHRGTSYDSVYQDLDGAPGGYIKFLKVYGRAKLPCKRCKTILVKTVVAGRGTSYCSSCQK